jgi:mRNA-degrading endonuclease RelE of RelBE toxin-antitoxin system
MWDHRNQGNYLNDITPTNLREIKKLNKQITKQFEDGIAGLGHKDCHWLAKPLAHVLKYNLEQDKAQWLDSIKLARTRLSNRNKSEALSIWHQREFVVSWMLNAVVASP